MKLPHGPNAKFTMGFVSCAIKKSILSQAGIYLSLAGSLAVGTAFAGETELETITVTAEKREGNILDIASSISAKSAAYLEDAEIFDLTELSQHIPNLHAFSWGGRRDTNIFIRGIGPGLFTDPTVGFYVDGINYTNNGSFNLDLMDVQHIEVLRGPQGTLYGGNSLAGVINIVTRPPTNETKGQLAFSVDDLSQRKLSASLSTPLGDSLFFGGAISVSNSDGYITNIYNNEDYGERDDIAARAKLRWLASEHLEATFTLDYEKFEGDSYAMGPYDAIKAKPQEVDHDFIGDDNRDSIGASLSINWSDDNIEITSITSWKDWENFNSADQDGGSVPGFAFHSRSNEEHNQISQEIRWNNKSPDQLKWIFGLYGYSAEFDVLSRNTQDNTASGMGGPFDSSIATQRDDNGYAAFGQIDYALTKQLALTAGLRFDHQEREAFVDLAPESNDPSTKLEGNRDFDQILPKIALSYTTESNALVYASISEGYRAGGFDTLYPNPERPTFDSETSINYEVGYKSRLLDDALEISAAAFLIDIKDQQIQQLNPATFTVITENAGESRSQGFEFESRYIPTENWVLSFSGNYTNADFKEYIGLNVATFTIEDYSANALPNTPKWTASFSVQNRHPLGTVLGYNNVDWFTQLDNQFIDNYFFGAQNELEQSSYHLLNFKTGIEAENWQAYLWIKNARNEYYSKIEFNFGFGPTAEAAAPRSAGLTVRYQF
jgi:iron complex outermembrane receptor protein